ncbi:MAG: hypothetical protein R3A10_09810 [Caldilineaceae bacterium]
MVHAFQHTHEDLFDGLHFLEGQVAVVQFTFGNALVDEPVESTP